MHPPEMLFYKVPYFEKVSALNLILPDNMKGGTVFHMILYGMASLSW